MKTPELTEEQKAALILACRWAYQNPEGQTVWKEIEAAPEPTKEIPVVEPRPLNHY